MIEEVLSVKCQVLSRARRAACSRSLLTSSFRPSSFRRNADRPEAIPQCVTGDGVFARKTQNTVLAHVVFWCSGILVFWAGAPKNAVLWTPAPCVFGTWHVAVWILGAKTTGTGGNWIEEAMAGSSIADCGLCKTKPIPRGRAEARDAESATIFRPHPRDRHNCFPVDLPFPRAYDHF